MGNANSIIKKVTGVLNKIGPPSRLAYLRTVTRTNSDPLTGNTGTVSSVDALFDPQPYYKRLGRQRLTGGHAKFSDVLDSSGNVKLADDYEFIFSCDATPAAIFDSPDLMVVLKDSSGGEELLRMTDQDSPMLYGGEVVRICYMRSIKRP